MVTYKALEMQHIQELAGNDPYIFAGDLNFKTDDPCYSLITIGEYNG